MRYTNYTNMDARFCRGYETGDRLVKGWEGEVPPGCAATDRLEYLFAKHNRDDRPDGQLCPSMSVGDVVELDGRWHTVVDIGFESVTVDPDDLITDRTWREVPYRENGIHRCPCGCKYWERDRCVDCGGTDVVR